MAVRNWRTSSAVWMSTRSEAFSLGVRCGSGCSSRWSISFLIVAGEKGSSSSLRFMVRSRNACLEGGYLLIVPFGNVEEKRILGPM